MIIDKNGNIKENDVPEYNKISKSKKAFQETRKISSIFLDNAIKTDSGYLFTKENMSTTINRLITYLKNKS